MAAQLLFIALIVTIISGVSSHQCTDNPPTLSPNSGVGKVQQLGGLNSYISGSANSDTSVVLISDVYGYEAPHLRMLADKVAAAGFYTVVPDFFRGDPFVNGRPDKPFHIWFKNHKYDQGFEDAKVVVEAIKRNNITKIGVAGFCWGGKVNVELTKHAYIDAAVLLHPSNVSIQDIRGVKVPISILGAEIDQFSPPMLVREFESILKKKPEFDSFVKIFPGATHGWTIRYKDEDKLATKSAEEAHNDMLSWFIKHLK
ncbi:1,4-beta-D-glucanase [Sesamum alatum]|uniref:1,4-beta-D-glucanase n=1 Tax=Sesamum alatum TaxID=300844 RepID=A0AAE1YPT6_9LAMI|nr:1,4-beta-D-glucanase [Sesamum alatum]